MSIKVVITDYIEPDMEWETAEFAKLGVEFSHYQLKFAPAAELIAATEDADVVVVNMAPITPEIIAGWKKCKLVIRHGAGYDNVNVPALTARGIPLCYTPDYCSEEVAEQAIALLFACGRKVVRSRKTLDDSMERGTWDFSDVIPMFRMEGKTLGIVGCGRIGSIVLRKLRSFGFKFLVCDPYLSKERITELDVEVVDLKTLLNKSDYVTIHTPLNDETRGLMNAKTLAYMKPGSYLVNTARGPVVDANALAEVLKSGAIAGAGIDVFDKEPPETTYPLRSLPNAVLTPHLAWYSEDAGMRIREIIALEVDRFMQGLPPRYTVNKEVLKARV